MLDDILSITKIHNLKLSENVLFIANDINLINSTKQHCKTFHVSSAEIIKALSINHMIQIESILGVYSKDDIYDRSFNLNL